MFIFMSSIDSIKKSFQDCQQRDLIILEVRWFFLCFTRLLQNTITKGKDFIATNYTHYLYWRSSNVKSSSYLYIWKEDYPFILPTIYTRDNIHHLQHLCLYTTKHYSSVIHLLWTSGLVEVYSFEERVKGYGRNSCGVQYIMSISLLARKMKEWVSEGIREWGNSGGGIRKERKGEKKKRKFDSSTTHLVTRRLCFFFCDSS